ncbi:hypothetical protein [Chryseobacterium gambrini]|uniref:hypothetical protein n=1 Tax=Chryseobacterium gambrini TaxID=373672 RepID=UPI003D10D4E0
MSNEQNITQDQYESDYIRGFEDGYDLSLWEPDIAKMLSQIKSDTPYMEGIRNANIEFDKELAGKETLPDFLRTDRLETMLNNREQEQDKGRELEI